MIKKKILLLILLLVGLSVSLCAQRQKGDFTKVTSLTASTEENEGNSTSPMWLRYNSISPDGSKIAFCYQGDIYVVSVNGGEAKQLTTNEAYDVQPIWSSDSKQIVFSSDREGSMDVYMVSANGGAPQRLTTYSGSERAIAFLNKDKIVYQAYKMPTAATTQFPSGQYEQLYTVDVKGGRPEMMSAWPMEEISVSKDGRILYQDKKGYEDYWRKHHTSSITRDIWLKEGEKHSKLTDFKGEDRNPIWASDYNSFYYLSEQNGTFNVYKKSITEGSASKQISFFKTHPVRFLSVAENGTICISYNGELYTFKEGEEPVKLNISIVKDKEDRDVIKQKRTNGADDIAVSPAGKEIAFIMGGDVYVTSTDYKTTKQITNTPEQERNIDFSPDGKSLVYSSERNGVWQIYVSSIVSKDEKQFVYATELKEENITNSNETSFQPLFSPDGKEVAFLKNRTGISVVNLDSKKTRNVMDAKFAYSYQDGDQEYAWSPDGKWIVSSYIGTGGWVNQDLALVKADGSGEIHNLTNSGYSESVPRWVLGGKALLFVSDRQGYRSHGSWGAEFDAYLMFFDRAAYEKFNMDKEQLALLEEQEKEEKKDQTDKQKEKDSIKETKKVEELEFDLDYIEDRTIRLTASSSALIEVQMSKKGDKLYYISPFKDKPALWVLDLKEQKTELKIQDVGFGSLEPDKEGSKFYMVSNGGIKKIDVASGTIEPVEYEAFYTKRPAEERAYLLDHIWKQVQDKFYDTSFRGLDWKAYYDNYEKFLPHINNGYDFKEMVSELLGELNASHTGCRYYTYGAGLKTAVLGIFIDESYKGDGLKIHEILHNSPLALLDKDIPEGSIITKIDGNSIIAGEDYYPLLEGKSGVKTRLTIQPAKGKAFDVIIKPISSGKQNGLLYERWVKKNEAMVDSLSGGRLAYVHIHSMNSDSYRTLYRKLLNDKNRNREAVIVDTRHNGGGWLHDDVCTLLSGKEYVRFTPREQYVASEPHNKWTKPSCMLVCEDNYSDAHGTPFVYKELKIGKLIGTPVPGTMTAVWWESLPGNYVFGIPQVGAKNNRGQYLENLELKPDILIYNTPETVVSGRDLQIEAAVKEMLRQVDSIKK